MKLQKYILTLIITACLYVMLIGSVYLLQGKIIFQPVPLPENHDFQFKTKFEEFNLTASDGAKINSLFFPAEGQSKGGLLYLHGNADNLQRWGNYTSEFTLRGYDVFIIDYRTYGKSKGVLNEDALYQDVLMAYQWLRNKYPAEQLVLYGRSLGSSMASELAAKVPAKMLILETPFNNIQNLLTQVIFPLYLPFDLDYNFANDRHIRKVDYPVHIIHGTQDDVVPFENAIKLKKQLRPKDSFTIIENGGHKNLSDFDEYHLWLDRLLE